MKNRFAVHIILFFVILSYNLEEINCFLNQLSAKPRVLFSSYLRNGEDQNRNRNSIHSSEQKGKVNPKAGKAASESRADKPDPWKILQNNLGNSRNSTQKFGKVKLQSKNEIDELQCPHFDVCSGCTVKSKFTETPTMIRATNVFKSLNIPFKIHMGNLTQWRTLVKLAIQPMSKWGGLRFGLYKEGSHEVVPIPECRIHHPRINEASEMIRLAALTTGVRGYIPGTVPSESGRKSATESTGDLRYLQLSVERFTQKLQLVLVWNAVNYKSVASLSSLSRFLKLLKKRDDLFHSIYINFHPANNNNVFYQNVKAWNLVFGPPTIREKIGRCTFYFRPQIFKQANIDYFEGKIIPYIRKFIPQGSSVAELYAGIGIIGLNIADLAEDVLLSDANPFVNDVFDRCAATLPLVRDQIQFWLCKIVFSFFCFLFPSPHRRNRTRYFSIAWRQMKP
jgi:hypothetical protein